MKTRLTLVCAAALSALLLAGPAPAGVTTLVDLWTYDAKTGRDANGYDRQGWDINGRCSHGKTKFDKKHWHDDNGNGHDDDDGDGNADDDKDCHKGKHCKPPKCKPSKGDNRDGDKRKCEKDDKD